MAFSLAKNKLQGTGLFLATNLKGHAEVKFPAGRMQLVHPSRKPEGMKHLNAMLI